MCRCCRRSVPVYVSASYGRFGLAATIELRPTVAGPPVPHVPTPMAIWSSENALAAPCRLSAYLVFAHVSVIRRVDVIDHHHQLVVHLGVEQRRVVPIGIGAAVIANGNFPAFRAVGFERRAQLCAQVACSCPTPSSVAGRSQSKLKPFMSSAVPAAPSIRLLTPLTNVLRDTSDCCVSTAKSDPRPGCPIQP